MGGRSMQTVREGGRRGRSAGRGRRLARAARACERQHGVAVKTWLADDVSCAPVADFVYARVEAHECPIQHYDSTPDVASIQACAWACDSQLSCVGFAWGIPSNAVAPLRPCALTETCDAASAYLRPAADQRRSSYFKIPRERPFTAGAAAPCKRLSGCGKKTHDFPYVQHS